MFHVRACDFTGGFGWQCTGYPGANCWDSGPHRDEIAYLPRPWEGVRKTAAPTTHTLTEGDQTITQYPLRDQVSGQFWALTFGTQIQVVVSTAKNGPRAWVLNDPWRLYLVNGILQVAKTPQPEEAALPADLYLFVNANGQLQYTPQS